MDFITFLSLYIGTAVVCSCLSVLSRLLLITTSFCQVVLLCLYLCPSLETPQSSVAHLCTGYTGLLLRVAAKASGI